MSLTLDETAILKAINDNFMNQVQVTLSLYAKYNPHMLGLLEDADYKQRVRRLREVVVVYTNRMVECAITYRDVEKRKKKIEAMRVYKMEPYDDDGEEKKRKVFSHWSDLVKAEQYQILLRGDINWYERNMDILSQAESHFAIFRSIALVEAFKEYKKKVSNIIGVGEEQMKHVKRELGKKRKKASDDQKSARFDTIKNRVRGGAEVKKRDALPTTLSEDDKAKVAEAGLDPGLMQTDMEAVPEDK